MAERVTKVRLDAVVSGYVAGMNEAARATDKTASAAEKLKAKQDAFDKLGKGALAVGALAAAGLGLAISRFAAFDKAMSSVQAATMESAENMALLRDAALDAGAQTTFTASEAAGAIEELAKAGVSTADVLSGGLKGSLDLAAAGEVAVGEAAEIAASALTQFNLAGSDVPKVADLLAAGAGKAQGTVQDLGAALNQAGLVSSQMGLTIEETTGSLAAFASAGLTGSDAGTAFRAMLLRLANPTDEAKQAMTDLGISAYDASGQFVGMESLAGQLQTRLGTLTQAERDKTLALIFGQDAIRTANILYREGASGIAEWTSKVDDAGYAAEVAEARMDNLSGDIEKLGGALDTALIKTGSAANAALRGLVQGAEELVDGFANAPQAVQTTALVVGTLTAGVGLLGGAALIAIPRIAALRVGLIDLGLSAATADKAMHGAALGVKALGAAGAIAAVSAMSKDFFDASREALGLKENVDSLKKSLSEIGAQKTIDNLFGGRVSELTDGGVFSDFLKGAQEAVDWAEDWNVGMQAAGVETSLTTAKFKEADAAMASLVSEGRAEEAAAMYEYLASQTNGSSEAMDRLNALLPQYSESQSGAASATSDAAAEVEEFQSQTDFAAQSVDAFVESLRGLGNEQLSLNEANRQVEESLDAFNETIAANGQTLDITTEAGRQNEAALDAIAKSYLAAAAATVEQTGKQADAIPVIQRGRDAIVAAGRAAGLSKDQAKAYADELGLIPGNVKTQVDLQADAAMARAREMARLIDTIPNSKTTYLYIQEQRQVLGPGQQGQTMFANGGMVTHANAGGNMWAYQSGIYAGRAGALYKYAEPETRWEAFISGKPGQEARNRGIALDALERLGGVPAMGGGSGPVSVSLEGARIVMDIDGRSVTGIIREQAASVVSGYDRQSRQQARRGFVSKGV